MLSRSKTPEQILAPPGIFFKSNSFNVFYIYVYLIFVTGLVKESELSPDSVILGVSELWQGVESFRPSVTDEELAYYESLQSQM